MQLLKSVFFVFIVAFVAGCSAAKGPIKAYDTNAAIDKESLSAIFLPPEIELLEVNGSQMETPFIETGYNEIHIPPGKHQLAVKYSAYWGDAVSGSMVKSDPVVMELNIAPKSTYYLKYKQPKDQWEALQIAGTFLPWIEDASGKKIKVIDNMSGGGMLTSSVRSASGQNAMPGHAPLENLKFWWKKASYKDKKEFETWMGNN